jgi:Co/Zn/Cd efflux system component
MAIVALLAGRYFGWIWLDPIIGIAGTVVIAAWAVSLIRSAGAILLDTVPSADLAAAIRARLERDDDKVVDLHLWRLGPGHTGVIASIVSDHPHEPDAYKARLAQIPGLSHVTIEVQTCAHA